MAELILTDINDALLNHLQERAMSRGRTPEDEAKAILADALQGTACAAWASVDEIYERLAASGGNFSDSANLLREDRDR